MTVQSVITDLETAGAVKVYNSHSYDVRDRNKNYVNTVHNISYRVPVSADVDSEPKEIQLLEVATFDAEDKRVEGGEVKYAGSVPPILRETPVTPEQREFIMTPQEAIAEIEAHYLAETPDWNGEVFGDSIDMRRINSRDQIFVDIVNHQKKVEKRREFIVSGIQAEPWSQPAGAHDAIAPGEYRTHNGKTWKNIHTDGNAWEPGTTNSQWQEVSPVNIRPVKSNL